MKAGKISLNVHQSIIYFIFPHLFFPSFFFLVTTIVSIFVLGRRWRIFKLNLLGVLRCFCHQYCDVWIVTIGDIFVLPRDHSCENRHHSSCNVCRTAYRRSRSSFKSTVKLAVISSLTYIFPYFRMNYLPFS